ncbi:hypothetical protein AKJ54_00200 [candidate division MSBL1 archaeon SCGC-AAA382K21]|uniref:Uncharacterized protein n=1 Tax=candidate division MSBL1 archaeon SCGC-AAA382K21 TaxID=1698283 RepID=A0A133VM31_9EURY|nr:hypothetical protein AKJ54_00200 [candidate division MSBL1 archaeon SCGC-AAA382K21]
MKDDGIGDCPHHVQIRIKEVCKIETAKVTIRGTLYARKDEWELKAETLYIDFTQGDKPDRQKSIGYQPEDLDYLNKNELYSEED